MRRSRIHAILFGLTLALSATAGCQKPLLAEGDDRTQYDRYDAVRNQRSPQSYFDEFGRKRPALRDRLLSKE